MSRDQQADDQHPDLADLELIRTGEAAEYVAEHVAACARCQEQVAFLGRMLEGLRIQEEAFSPSAATDQAVFAVIDERIDSTNAPVSPFHSWRIGMAAAALVICSLLGWWLFVRQESTAPSTPAPIAMLPGDVNRDGRVDIVDAYLMAERLNSSNQAPLEWDQNSDGRVDQLDVELVAAKAVRLSEEGS